MSTDTIDTASRELWDTAKSYFMMTLKTPEDKSQAERYFGMITTVAREGDVFTIFTSSSFAADLIRSDYANRLKGAFAMADAPEMEIKVQYDERAKINVVVPPTQHTSPYVYQGGSRQSSFVSTLPLNEDYTFDSFVRGPSNSYAISAAEGVVNNPAKPLYNPLFIHGGTGLGKTHLMQAIGNELRRRNPSMAICYLTSETFLNEYVTSLQNGQIENFRHKYRSIDLLLIDDIQFMAQKKDLQVEFFNTFNALKDQRKQIVMTSDVAPKNLPSIEERLISRFEGGMVQEVESPSYETRLAILKKKTEISESRVPDSVLEYIADNIKSHVRAMEGALTRVTLAINADPRLVLNNETLGRLLRDYIEKEQSMRKLTIEEIQQACAKKYGVTLKDILSHEKIQSIVTPRQLAMYICRKLTSKGLQEIATAFGKKHATVIHGVKSISDRLSCDTELRVDLEDIISSFGYRLSDAMD
ncbi:MAG: chromosomal replication initiator protein DnaA [Kiritimatiellae bacterium]|nr:chromosomal replication initiator protein DnaA [Kiritimatiellia bacterium]